MKKGIAASKGYAIGKALLKKEVTFVMDCSVVSDTEKEINRLKEAIEKTRLQLTNIKEKTIKDVGEEEALVFDAHLMFLEDPEFMGTIEGEIKENKLNAMQATDAVSKSFLEIFSMMDDEYMRERASDIKDVSKRILNNLAGVSESIDVISDNTIVVAHDLTPSDTAQLDKDKVIAFITEIGGRTSHTAIMARTLEIPAIVGAGDDFMNEIKDGDVLIVDGIKGEILINPTQEEIENYKTLNEEYNKQKEELKKLIDVKSKTVDGKRIEIAGNIGKPSDVTAVLASGADGIGLFRTEFLYMDRSDMPSEEEQFKAYSDVLKAMENKPVVIRTLDIGGDKKLEYLPLPEEMNPFLGYRAIRLCLDRREIFKIQLRALLRASVYGNLRVMFPMIAKVSEFKEAMEVVNECKEELKSENVDFSNDIQWGIMVEIPSAAVFADEFAKYVDFFSIGTNDLIQYTLAADRMSEKVSYLYDPMNPSVLRLIKMTIDGAHKEGKWCGMCGEMAGDETAIPKLLDLGLDEFSMSASSILPAKKIVNNHTINEVKSFLEIN